jgi:copper chaperone
MNKEIIKVEGMTCNHCAANVTRVLMNLEGVSQVEVNLEEKTVSVDYNSSLVSLVDIKNKINKLGYRVTD